MNGISFGAQWRLSRFFQKLVAAAGLSLLALGAQASPEKPQNGLDYFTMETAQPTEPGNKVEVIEFFWYACGVCNVVEPSLHAWQKAQGANVVLKRIPTAFRPEMEPQQKLYYSLEALGLVDTLHTKVFQAIHGQRIQLNDEAAILKWVGTQGVDMKAFTDAFNSFGVKSKVARAQQLQKTFRIDGVPTFIVDGRYVTSPSIVANSVGNKPLPVLTKAAFQVIDQLVAQRLQVRTGTASGR